MAILRATGVVGQRFMELLHNHPWFEVEVLVASKKSAGKRYGEVSNWILESEMPHEIAEMAR